MASPRLGGVSRLVRALACSLAGLRAAFVHEEAFRQEIGAFAVLAPVGLWIGEGWVEKALLLSVLMLVAVVELLNSAIEAVVDRIGGDWDELSGRAKDMGSAAVLLALLVAALVWGSILLPHWF